MSKAFLTCYTPTFRRPTLLAQCIQSVQSQQELVQHVIVPDEVGLGWGVFTDVKNHAHKCTGQYVHFLSDDCALLDDLASRDLRRFADDAEYPAVIIWKGQYPDSVCPWQPMHTRPRLGHINLGNFVVRLDVWLANKDTWIADYAGDFYFVDSLWERGHNFSWMDRIGWRTLAIMNGQPESAAATADGRT